MRRDIRRFIEAELRDYDNTKREWELIQESIVESSQQPADGMPRGSTTSNVPESKAIKLLTNKRMAQLERTIKAIEKTMMRLPEEKFRLIQLRYWTSPQLLSDEGIAREVGCDKSTLYRWTDAILSQMAREMGFVD